MSKRFTKEQFITKFWEKVDKTSDPQGCWLWTAGKSCGYGSVGYRAIDPTRATMPTHTVAYLLSGKIIPDGLELAHSEHCVGKRHCCNPDHLTPKTRQDNSLDKHRDNTMTNAKLTKEQVLFIRASDKCNVELASEFGCTKENISSIKLKKSWRHI
jgi:hypothetical protein